MGDNEKTREPDVPSATDAEVASAAKQLGLKVGGSPALRRARSGQVLQSLTHGRSHMVAVEIRPSRRRSKAYNQALAR